MGKKKTDEEFKREVYDLVGDEYEFLEEYKTSKTKIKVVHNTCGYEYEVRPGNFLRGNRCSKCMRPNYNRDTSQFKQEVYELVGTEYEVLGEYKGSGTPITMIHNICGHKYDVRPSDFLRGKRCGKCFGTKKKTAEQFKKEVYELVGTEYEVLGEYINTDTPILMIHNVCNTIYPVTPNKFLSGRRCSECAGNKKKTTETFKEEVFELVGDEYEVLGEYINNKHKILMKHNVCKDEHLYTPSDFLSGKRCPNCAGNKKKTTEIFKKEVFELVGDEYDVLGEYINALAHILIRHNKCGNEYPVAPAKFLYGNRCPICSSSKGENFISSFLIKHSINYKHNISYGGCRYKEPLRFDFLIFDNDNNLKLICEFDGIQHFEPVEIFGGEEGFKETKIRDNIKNEFCKDKEIPLLRIPYWEIDNIHKILGKKLYKLGLIK